MEDPPDVPAGGPLRMPPPRRRRRPRPRHPWTGLTAEVAGAFPYPAAPPARAVVFKVTGFHFVLGVDRDGRLVGVTLFSGNTRNGSPWEERGKAAKGLELARFGWTGNVTGESPPAKAAESSRPHRPGRGSTAEGDPGARP